MAEQINVDNPNAGLVNSSYQVNELILNWTGSYIRIGLISNIGNVQHFEYDGDKALNLMRALNKSNLSTKSLQRRIIEQLIADGKLSGAVAGVPD